MRWSIRESRLALRAIGRHGSAHRRALAIGLVATLFVSLVRVAMPWPLRGVLEIAMSAVGVDGGGSAAWGWSIYETILAYVALAMCLGLAEMVQRVHMKKYAAGTVRNMRDAAVESIVRTEHESNDADIISRLIGDAARAKAQVSGILVHASQNSILFLGIVALFLYLSPKLGLFFLVGGVFAIAIGYRTTSRVADITLKQREKEADYALVVREAVREGAPPTDGRSLNEESAVHDVRATRAITVSSWAVHTGLAIIAGLALLVAHGDVMSGRLLPGELFLFIAYVLTVHRRLVQVGRQLARTGKLVANVNRIDALITTTSSEDQCITVRPLAESLELVDVRVGKSRTGGGRRSLKRTNCNIAAGSTVLVTGGTGSGKSTLLRVISGREDVRGEILWDGVPVSSRTVAASPEVRYVSDATVFSRARLGILLGLGNSEIDAPTRALLKALGLDRLIRTMPKGLATKVSSATVTRAEAKSISLFALLSKNEGALWVIDEPFAGAGRKDALKRLDAIADRAFGRTIVIGSSRFYESDAIDHVVRLKNGRVTFSGSPTAYREERAERRRAPQSAGAPRLDLAS